MIVFVLFSLESQHGDASNRHKEWGRFCESDLLIYRTDESQVSGLNF